MFMTVRTKLIMKMKTPLVGLARCKSDCTGSFIDPVLDPEEVLGMVPHPFRCRIIRGGEGKTQVTILCQAAIKSSCLARMATSA